MKRLLLLLLLIPLLAGADEPFGYQQITSLSSSTGLTVATDPRGSGEKAQKAVIRVETQAVRWRDDGTAPTSSVGIPLNVGDVLTYNGDLGRLKFIEQTASAKINVSYYR